jgi:hypothetical protein
MHSVLDESHTKKMQASPTPATTSGQSKKACIQIVLLNITYAIWRFDARDQRSIHSCSAHYGSAWFFSREGNLFDHPREERECRPYLREEIALETLEGWPDCHNARQERCEHPHAFPSTSNAFGDLSGQRGTADIRDS